MVPLGSLLLPVVLSAVLVFFASFLIHMVLRYHSSDYTQLPNEDAVRAAIRAGTPAPKQYIIPYCKDLRAPAKPTMGPYLTQWFVFNLVVAFFVAYVAAHTIPPGTVYLEVFRVVGAVTFLAYAAGVIPAAIWMAKPWPVALKEALDGLIYGLVTAGTFGWLWPR